MAPTKNDNWIRKFEVTDPRRHKNGFTVYKVTSVVFPRSAPEAATKVSVWKRYNDFKKLYNKLKFYHKSCKINEELPKLSKAKYFKRFDEDVINERTKSALELLNFIGGHQALFTCDPFLHFFHNGYQMPENSSTDNNTEVLDNGNCVTSIQDAYHCFDAATVNSDGLTRDGLLTLGGTWGSRLAAETISIHSQSSDEESTLASDTTGSVSPVQSVSSPSKKPETCLLSDSLNRNNFETALDVVEDPALAMNDRMAQSVISEKKNSVDDGNMTKSTSFLPDHFGSVGETVTCHSEKPIKPSEMWLSVRTQDFSSISRSYLAPGLTDSEAWLTPPGTPAGKQDYLVEAAYHVGEAQNYEASGEFEAAFSFYKAAIACLLSGVHDDEDKTRRRAVREKTAQYLRRAEQIYALHLSMENGPVPPTIVDLKIYKVLSIIDKVMLVLNTLEDKCYVIKVLEKSPCPVDAKKKTIIPRNVPYMVQLVKYFENESSIFLVLQHARGGKLWDHIDNYLRSLPSSPAKTPDECKLIGLLDEEETKAEELMDKSYLELIRDYTTSTAKKFLGFGETQEGEASNDDEVLSESLKKEIVSNLIVNSSPMPDLVQPQSAIEETIKELNIDSLNVTDLVENSQRLLNSVNETLLNSESVTSNLNKELLNMESVFDLEQRLSGQDGGLRTEMKNCKKRSSSAVPRPKFERRFSSEDLDSRSRTASNSLDRGGQWSRLAAMMEPVRPRLSEATIRSWAAELLVALETLHRWGIICRDLHPGNILLGDHGHLLLTFQIHWRGVDSLMSAAAIEGLFAAPETTKVFPVTPAADWWSYGALLYQLLSGKSLASCYPGGILDHTILVFPEFVSPEACSLVTELLRYEPSERLGGGVNGSDDIKSHPFFRHLDWQIIYDIN